MIYEVFLTNQAEDDLTSIYEYIIHGFKFLEIADRQLGRLEKGISDLQHFPERFHRYPNEPWRSRGLRVNIIDNYSSFYVVDKGKRTVTIMRVMYGKRNVEEQLNKEIIP